MRILLWMLGVIVTLEGLMTARHVAPAWVWVWWVFLGLWFVVGLAVLVLALVRAAAGGNRSAAVRVPAPRFDPTKRDAGGEHAG